MARPQPADRAPRINVRRLRGQLAERRISRAEFSEMAGMHPAWFSPIATERVIPGELSRWRIAAAVERLGLIGVITPWDDEEDDQTAESAVRAG